MSALIILLIAFVDVFKVFPIANISAVGETLVQRFVTVPGVLVGVTVGVAVGSGVDVNVGVTVGVGVNVGVNVGVLVGVAVGVLVAVGVGVGVGVHAIPVIGSGTLGHKPFVKT
jgi:hypothetical protein